MNEIQEILSNATIENNSVKLNCGQINRALYTRIDDVLKRLWGKWSGKHKKHQFPFDPTDMINAYIETGILPPKNELAYFPTPGEILEDIKREINLCRKVLEPSAGQGAIVGAILEERPEAEIDCYECSEINHRVLAKKGFNAVHADFLNVLPKEEYDTIVMNPPFSVAGDKTAYMTHIYHAFKFLKKGGKLVCITPVFVHKKDKKTAEFKDFIASRLNCSYVYKKGTFKDSGTMVETCLYSINKEEHEPDFFADRFDWFANGNYGYDVCREQKSDLTNDEYIEFAINYSWSELQGQFFPAKYKPEYLDVLKNYQEEQEEPEDVVGWVY